MTGTRKARVNQLTYLFVGIFVTGVAIYVNVNNIVNGEFPKAIMLLVLGLYNLMMAYLSPHLFPKDERAKDIIGKAMTLNYFVLFGTLFILFLLTGSFGPITLDATQVLTVLTSVMVLTIPGTMVIYSKVV